MKKAKFLAAATAVFTTDLISKIVVRKSSMQIAQNSGISFGLLGSGSATAILLLNFAAALFLLFIGLCFAGKRNNTALYGTALMLGGCLGNLCDRFLFARVTDWITVPFSKLLFSNGLMLNIADFAIIAGFCLIFADALKEKAG